MPLACIPLQPLLLLLGLLACHVAAQTAVPVYDPRTKDWASVIAACKDVGAQEKRLMSFVIRTSFHDSLSVTNINCNSGCGGAGRPLLRLTQCINLWLCTDGDHVEDQAYVARWRLPHAVWSVFAEPPQSPNRPTCSSLHMGTYASIVSSRHAHLHSREYIRTPDVAAQARSA
jgi:hypothetical protein